MRGAFLAGAAVILTVLLYLLLSGSDGKDERRDSAGRKGNGALSRTERIRAMDAALDRAERKDARQETRYLRLSDPGGNWSAILPQGRRWTEPVDEGNQNVPENPRYRTVIWGPQSTFILVETTPYEDPVNNEANYVVDGLRVESEPVNGNLSGEVMRFEGRSGDCAGLYCVKALLSDGYSGGVAIVTGSRSPSLAERTVEAFTGSVQRRLD